MVMVAALQEQVSTLQAESRALHTENERLRAENRQLRDRITELQAQLKTNSRNSSKPPSTDGLGKSSPKSSRKRSKRNRGGQPGHPGSSLAQVENPDELVRHEPDRCRCCARSLTGRSSTPDTRRRQVVLVEAQVPVPPIQQPQTRRLREPQPGDREPSPLPADVSTPRRPALNYGHVPISHVRLDPHLITHLLRHPPTTPPADTSKIGLRQPATALFCNPTRCDWNPL